MPCRKSILKPAAVPVRFATSATVQIVAAGMANVVNVMKPATAATPWWPPVGGAVDGTTNVEAEVRFFLCRSRHFRAAMRNNAAAGTTTTSIHGHHKYQLTAPLLKAWLKEYGARRCTTDTVVRVTPTLLRRSELAIDPLGLSATPRLEFGVVPFRVVGSDDDDALRAVPRRLLVKSLGRRTAPVSGLHIQDAENAIGFSSSVSAPPATEGGIPGPDGLPPREDHSRSSSDDDVLVCADAKVIQERSLCLADLGLSEGAVNADVLLPFERWWEQAYGAATVPHLRAATIFLGLRVLHRRSFAMPGGLRVDVTAVESTRIPVAVNAPRVPAAALLRRVPADFIAARELDPLASLGHDAWIDAVCGADAKPPAHRLTTTGPTRSMEMELEFVDGKAAVGRLGAKGAAEVLLKRADRMLGDLDVVAAAAKRSRYGGRGFVFARGARPASERGPVDDPAEDPLVVGHPGTLKGGSDKPLDLSSVADDDDDAE